MKINALYKILLALTMVFALSLSNDAQTTDAGPDVWLNGGGGTCYADAYDNGAAPMNLLGVGLGFQSGVRMEWGRCCIQRESRYLCGFLVSPFTGYVFGMNEGVGFLYRFHDGKRDRLHLWAGGSVREEGSLKVIPSLKTCAVSSAVFGNFSVEGMVQYDFAFLHEKSHNLLTAYGKLRLPIVGIVNYPGFSYMDNYMSNINLVYTILTTYETRGILFPGVCTDIGLRFNLLSGNKIGFSYRWDYLTTRHRGYYRFDNAFHTFTIDFMFKLN